LCGPLAPRSLCSLADVGVEGAAQSTVARQHQKDHRLLGPLDEERMVRLALDPFDFLAASRRGYQVAENL